MSTADIVSHVHPDLSADERVQLEEDLGIYQGMISIRVSSERPHLLTAVYDPDATSSADLLAHIGERGVGATKIG
ncbi:MAG: hypothetical protein BMS9Abin10_0658 [Gammaproteobacteria bacterium]|nr:MAG: hypothetical protein BMS9Abin10_0658 [Gammaproteobacteria bacterium]